MNNLLKIAPYFMLYRVCATVICADVSASDFLRYCRKRSFSCCVWR